MAEKQILCPICDQELGVKLEELPDKCPICDTRRHELLQMLEEDSQQSEALEKTQQKETIEGLESTQQREAVLIEEPLEQTQQRDAALEEPLEQTQQREAVLIEEPAEKTQTIHEEYEDSPYVSVPSQEEPADVIFPDEEPIPQIKIPQTPEKPPIPIAKHPNPQKKVMKTGASALETLPEPGKGFASGEYLILYNSERKAIAYFCLSNAGSVIIGRSNERGSPNDIDLAIAWRNYYKQITNSEEEFREKIMMVKGLSHKHALIRYDQEKKQYVFFHLSDKNFSIVTMGEERIERQPGNRNQVYLNSGALISMGNQKNFIVMRFKKIENNQG